MTPGRRPVVLGVAGGSGSGKSTVVREICRILGDGSALVIHHDAYYRDLSHLPRGQRATVNFDHPESLDTELMVDHVTTLLEGTEVELPTYDFSTHARSPATERRAPAPVVILDGILVLADARLRALMDLKVFVDTDADIRLIRRLRRDLQDRGRSLGSVIDQYEQTVRPMHRQFVEPSKRHADVIVPEGGRNSVAVRMLVDTVRTTMEGRERHPGRGGP